MAPVSRKKYVSQFPMMGTIITLTLFEKNSDAVNAVYDYLETENLVFSANRPDSELMAVNASAGLKPVKVSEECFRLVADAIGFSRQFPESFNVLIGPLVKLWKIGFGGETVPDASAIKERLSLVNLDNVQLDAEAHTIFLKQPGMELDLGAVAKGYFADQIVRILKQHGLQAGVINLGGNVKSFGLNPLSADAKWQIGIRNPFVSDNHALLTVNSDAKTYVTSGIHERFMQVDGKTYHHILSPQTGYPVDNDVVQVTIITDNSEVAEVLSTVSFFGGITQGKQLIEQMLNTEAIFIDKNHQIHLTSGITNKRKGVYAIE